MHIYMAGADINSADISQREALAFTEERTREIITELAERKSVSGAVLLATCNRTELYITADDDFTDSPSQILAGYAGEISEKPEINVLEDDYAVQHIMEVACGLHSRILHEEQIVTQVGNAVSLARECHSAGAVLDTLFRTAVSAGKDAQTQISFSAVPMSVSHSAVKMLSEIAYPLNEKRCLVIGNGNMGRLSATLLAQQGCRVYVTLRSYHHGETVIPFRAEPVSYEKRFEYMENADIVISATRSPHYTILKSQLEKLRHKPAYMVDLAMPRDIEKSCGNLEGVRLYNLDDISDDYDEAGKAAVYELQNIAHQYAGTFHMWLNYRSSIPYIRQLKDLACMRIINSTDFSQYRNLPESDAVAKMAAEKTIDMLMGSLKSQINPGIIQECCAKIRDRGRF